jgi:8-oxo-dGTP pyrophosphatase MutT (NUDIX family)
MEEQEFHVAAKALFLNERKELLILKINPEDFKTAIPVHWDLPGGRIKVGAGIEDTLREELDIEDFEIGELFDVMISNMKIPEGRGELGLLIVAYLCKFRGNESRIRLNFEHTEYKWASIKEAKKLLAFKFPKSFLDKLGIL